MADLSAESIITVPWHQLHDSPLQYRQTYRESTIAEIAASIRDTGRIQQPLVVRLHYPNPLFRDQYDPQDGYEIVFGHTRKRGGMLAGLAGAPCIVRELTDAEVRAAQAAENIARADVHPIEEAQGFRAMIDADQVTADDLATQLGKSRSYVYGRLKLLALCPEVRAAVLAGEIGTEVGLLVARVGNAKLQAKALGYIRGKGYELADGGKRSFRNIRDLLSERFTLDLKTAISDVDDDMLVPGAGHCGRCPKRSGNAPEFVDIAEGKQDRAYHRQNLGADICTDPDCFDAKKRAHLQREVKRLESQGKTVITGNKAREAITATGELKGAYIELAKARAVLKAAGLGAPPEQVLIQDQRTGKTVLAVRRADVQARGAELLAERPRSAYGITPQEEERNRQLRAERDALVLAEKARRKALLDQVRSAVLATPRDGGDLRMIARWMVENAAAPDLRLVAGLWSQSPSTAADDDEDDDPSGLIVDLIDNLPPDDLARLMLDLVLVDDVTFWSVHHIDQQPENLLAAAARYGIPTPSAAGAGADLAAAGAGAVHGDVDAGDDADNQNQTQGAGAAGQEQSDDAGVAGRSTATAAAPCAAVDMPTVWVGRKPDGPPIKYRNRATGETWTGRGLQPAWLRVALGGGAALADFAVETGAAPCTAAA